MVYYYKSNTADPPASIYVGKDKVESKPLLAGYCKSTADRSEDEDLIKFGWEEDVW